jgi:hypothetical protein
MPASAEPEPIGPHADYVVTASDPRAIVLFERLKDGRIRVLTGDRNGCYVDVESSLYGLLQSLEPAQERFLPDDQEPIALRFRDPIGLPNVG